MCLSISNKIISLSKYFSFVWCRINNSCKRTQSTQRKRMTTHGNNFPHIKFDICTGQKTELENF